MTPPLRPILPKLLPATAPPADPDWICEKDVEDMLGGFSYVDSELLGQIIELLDPEQLEPDASSPSGTLANYTAPDQYTKASPSAPGSSASASNTSGVSSVDEEEEFDAMGRRRGGGKPQSLDGLSDRRRQQILRRRVRNRESMRRMRARYKGTKEQLHKLETALELRQQALDDAAAPSIALAASSMATSAVSENDASTILVAAAKQKLLELRRAELQLAQEQVSLRRELSRHEQSLQTIQQGLQELQLDAFGADSPEYLPSYLAVPREDDYSWVDRILPLLPQLAETNDVFGLVRQSYAEVLAASKAAEKYLAHANQVLGWRDTRMVNGAWLDFIFRKEVFRDSVDIIADRTWAMQSDGHNVNDVMPQKHAMRILRRINDSTLICARNLVFPGDPANYCTIYLLMRVHNGRDGYVVAQRTLEPSDPALFQQLLGPNHSYVSVFYGLMLSPRTKKDANGVSVVEPGCHVSFGGRVGNGTVRYASTWSMDILVAILRWETMCVGPILQLASDTTPSTDSSEEKQSQQRVDSVP